MYFTTIIFGSLRFIADLAFEGCGDLFNKNTLGFSLKAAVSSTLVDIGFANPTYLFAFIGHIFGQPIHSSSTLLYR